ncbi:MAG TPA: iron-containing redox enzyme family protein [Actinomycetota bacterium]|nr:iron-containing redox enzyme family protein [Actinomycetota bacterium]
MLALPAPRGPLSEALIGMLAGASPRLGCPDLPADARADDDLQLSLYLCYALHYGGIEGVPDEMEWSIPVLRCRAALETRFEISVRAAVQGAALDPGPRPGRPLARRLRDMIGRDADLGADVAGHLARDGTLVEYREFLLHRSAYHLMEADPFTWAIPRLDGAAKAALVQIQADEYGGGDPAWMHSQLFADTMAELGLDPAAGPPLDRLPGTTLATTNLISMFGLHRRLRGALVGHLAVFEMTSCVPNRRYAEGLRRLGIDGRATRFFDEHVEADAAHEAIAAHDLAGALVRDDPDLLEDVLFGAAAMLVTERRAGERMLTSWQDGRSSLRETRSIARPRPALVER